MNRVKDVGNLLGQFYLPIVLPWAGLPRERGHFAPAHSSKRGHFAPASRSQSPLEFLDTNCLTENIHSHCRIICSVIYGKTPFLTFYNYDIIGAIFGKFYEGPGESLAMACAQPLGSHDQGPGGEWLRILR
jgi:hypothetical protein